MQHRRSPRSAVEVDLPRSREARRLPAARRRRVALGRSATAGSAVHVTNRIRRWCRSFQRAECGSAEAVPRYRVSIRTKRVPRIVETEEASTWTRSVTMSPSRMGTGTS